jgi:N2227-like protein
MLSESFLGLVCPVCRTPLVSASEPARCERCELVYPSVSGIPCLMAEPTGFVQAALNRVASHVAVTSERAQGMLLEAQGADVSEKTRQRLQRLANGLLAEAQCLEALCQPLRDTASAYPAPLSALTTLLENPVSAVPYTEHVFRDWVWGEAENLRTLALVEKYLVEPTPTLAVFGAGTARLALDLSKHPLVDEVLAIDKNPLPFLVTSRLLSGSIVELVEFPLVPLAIEHVAIPRRIEPWAVAASGLKLIFADALSTPFADDSLDAVVTPWFIDDVQADLSEIATEVNRVLRPGGSWLNVGPLYYSGSASHAYSLEETLDIVRDHGFELTGQEAHSLAYFDSPVSGTCRIDRTYVFAARKVAKATRTHVQRSVVPWLEDATLPIPHSDALAAAIQRSVMTAGIGSLVDGTRTMTDIACALSESWGAPPNALLPLIRACLSSNTQL